VVEIQIFEPPGIQATPELVKEIEKHYTRQEYRRVAWDEVGELTFPARSPESYVHDLLDTTDVDAIRARKFRIVIDYSYSPASLVVPHVLGALDVEAVASHSYITERGRASATSILKEALGQTKRLVTAVGADLGAVFDPAAERMYLVDESAREVSVEQELLLFLQLLVSARRHGRVALPITVTSVADGIVEGSGLEVVRTPASLSALTRAAAGEGVVFAGAVGGGFVFPDFVPAYDAIASLCKLLELLAPVRRPLSEVVADLPASTVVHRQVRCPWARKGAVMRILTERTKGKDVDTLDGLKVYENGGWVQVLPDPDEPLVHVYAEAGTDDDAQRLEDEYVSLVERAIAGEEAAVA
jgi:mannose-1-phosphate guanylyltransferase/phosphomannomutase